MQTLHRKAPSRPMDSNMGLSCCEATVLLATNNVCLPLFFLECNIFTVQVSPSSIVSLQGKHQRRLYRDLMTDYNPLERPVFNDSQSLTVHFGFSLMQIMDVVCKVYTLKKLILK